QVQATTPTVMIIGGEASPEVQAALRAHDRFTVESSADDWRQRISEKRLRAAVELPADFDAAVQRGETVAVRIYEYAGEMRSGRGAAALREFFARYGERVVTARLAEKGLAPGAVKPFDVQTRNVAPPEKVGGNILGGMIPY